MGWSVAGMGDLDGDGFSDYVTGAKFTQVAGWSWSGSAHLTHSCPALAENYGSGWPGTNGVPELSISGSPRFWYNRTLTLGNSSGNWTLSFTGSS